MNILRSMKHSAAALLLAVCLAIPALGADAPAWGDNLDVALAEARESGKKVLVDFTGSDWCGFCIKLNNEVLSGDEFKNWAAENVVLVELDFPRKKEQSDELKARNKALKEKYEVPGFPTVLLIDPDGKVLHSEIGFEPGSGDPWLARVKAAAAPGE
jgi:protein disulfide-isomerase